MNASDTIEQRGFPTLDEIKTINGYPTEERFQKGKVAVIECIQGIPCNPCESACAFQAIRIRGNIVDKPSIDYDNCKGCGQCIAKCPGLAIFIIDDTYSDLETAITFPHEFLPLPRKGDKIQAVNRAGEIVTEAIVLDIDTSNANDGTALVTIAVPKKFRDDVRGIKRQGR